MNGDSQIPQASMQDTNRTVPIPAKGGLRRLFAFAGPAYMVAVGYMDPGNWATDLAGGSNLGYTLLWVLLMSNAMAVVLQTLSARLGLVTGRDLAQACRDEYRPLVRYVLFFLCEIAIIACDLAELLGSAVGITLLSGGHIPIQLAVVITGLDVLVLLAIQRGGIRKMEGLIIALISIIGICFIVEVFLSNPQWLGSGGVVSGLVPTGKSLSGPGLYIAIGILGATVMPHNLYLHSALVQSRDVRRSVASVIQACKHNLIDSVFAMNGAFLINAAILIVAAAVFHTRGHAVEELGQAHQLLEKLLGSTVAPVAFALALLAAGQSSTMTGTLAGQITMEGFLSIRIRPWLRRIVTRGLAIVPAVIVVMISGEKGIYSLLIFSQVVLSLQLPFAIVPLVRFTSSRRKMGPFANRRWLIVVAWLITAIIVALNVQLVGSQIWGWTQGAGVGGWIGASAGGAALLGLLGLLAWMIFRSETGAPRTAHPVTAQEVLTAAAALDRRFRRIGVALEAKSHDAAVIAQAVGLAKAQQSELVLMHVVEGVGGQWYGPQTGDMESRQDETYLTTLVEKLRGELAAAGVAVHAVLGYGDVPKQLVMLAHREGVDLLIMGSHGHKGLGDVVHGSTISAVRHGVDVPIFAVR
ncbi:MAG: Nramp family divalent metal transporter [Planctomycetaceae bacterium]|nr:Nramp family divalent metal transporter [Planctomycetaceae bacterium]